MADLSRIDWGPSETPVLSTVLNNIGADIRTAGANRDMGGFRVVNCAGIDGASNVITFKTSAAERVRIASDGKVGIGTASPSTPLSVKTAATTGVCHAVTLINPGGNAVNDTVRLRLGPGSGFDSAPQLSPYIEAIIDGATAAAGLALGTYSGSALAERIRITSSGNVGIGTVSPISRLTVLGGSHFADSMTLGSTASPNMAFCADQTNWGLFIGHQAAGHTWIQAGRTDTATAYNLLLQSSGGNVGIGTAAPTAKLHVAGLDTHASNAAAISAGKTAGAFYTDGSGAVKVVY